jgi:ABC-2 type transport system permease protein
LLSITVPIASIWVVIKYFAPNFNRKLSMISGSEGGAAPLPKNGKIISSTTSTYLSLVSKWFSRKGAERMAFLLTYKISSRSRDFKMKVYPAMGYLVVYLVMIFFTNKKITLAELSYGSTSSKILFISLIYFSSFILIMACGQIQYSDKFKAAWMYFTTPIKEPGLLISGAIRAMIVKFYLPLISIITLLSIVFMGPSIIPNLVLGCANQLFITAIVGYISIRELPFSHAQDQVKINFIRGLFTFLIPASVAGLHYLIYSFMPVVIILAVLAIIAYWMVMNSIRKKNWQTIITTYED